MKILIVPDSFKGSLSSRLAANAIAEGIKDLEVDFEKIPMADGGEGTGRPTQRCPGERWAPTRPGHFLRLR